MKDFLHDRRSEREFNRGSPPALRDDRVKLEMKTAPGRWLCGALLAAGCLALSGSRGETSDKWNGSASNGYIVSVLQRDDSVFASTDIGLFQAALSDKVWHKLPLPSSAPTWGHLAREAVRSPLLVYYTGRHGIDDITEAKAEFYVSKDFGRTWECASGGHHFTDVFVQSNGILYANEMMLTLDPPPHTDKDSLGSTTDHEGNRRYIWYRVMVSRDLGKNWLDISEGLSPQYSYFILRDFDHPERIRLSGAEEGHLSRQRFYEAADQNDHWKEIPWRVWRKDQSEREYIFGSLSPGSNDTSARADLSTLLKYPFLKWGNTISMQAVQIEAEKPAYTFRQHEPMPVALKAYFVFSRAPLRFADNEDETLCWALRGYPENGESFYAPARVDAPYVSAVDREAKLAAYRDDPAGRIVALDDDHPYHRTIDLSKLYRFPGPENIGSNRRKYFVFFSRRMRASPGR